MPNVSLAEAEAQLSGVAAALSGGATTGESAPGQTGSTHGARAHASSDTLEITHLRVRRDRSRPAAACANVATVLISTAMTREREMGVRAALGASRWRIVRQLVTESFALGTIAATIGLALPATGDSSDRHDDRSAGGRGPRTGSQRVRVFRDRHAGQRRGRGAGAGVARSRRRSSHAVQRRWRAPERRRTAAAAIVARDDPGRGLGAAHRPGDAVRARGIRAATVEPDSTPTGCTPSRSDSGLRRR